MLLYYNDAVNLMNKMESLGVVGAHNGAKPREVLINNINEVKI
jgi:DNA segregation ATPase FtsK/SpoIIIE-like protein